MGRRIKTNKRSMSGGDWSWMNPFRWGNSNPTDATTDADATGIIGVAKNAAKAVTDGADAAVGAVAKGADDVTGYFNPNPQAPAPAPTEGGRRRRHRKRMRGGDFIPNSPLTGFSSNATEVHDIKMAHPQTLVGGRRRKSSRRRGKSTRKRQRKSRSSRRN